MRYLLGGGVWDDRGTGEALASRQATLPGQMSSRYNDLLATDPSSRFGRTATIVPKTKRDASDGSQERSRFEPQRPRLEPEDAGNQALRRPTGQAREHPVPAKGHEMARGEERLDRSGLDAFLADRRHRHVRSRGTTDQRHSVDGHRRAKPVRRDDGKVRACSSIG